MSAPLTPYMKQVRAEQYEAGRLVQQKADVAYLRALAEGIRESAADCEVTQQIDSDTGAALRTSARALEVAADHIESGESRG